MTSKPESQWFCPLFGKNIAEGKCLDINYERLGYVSGGYLDDVKRTTGKQESEIAETCKACPNLPVSDELGSMSFPNRQG